jgi:hypothetical protein
VSPVVPATPISPPTATTLTLEAAHQLQLVPAKRLVALLNSVQDDATAKAAGPQIVQAGRELADGMKKFKGTVAAFSLGGKDAEVDRFFQERVERHDNLEEFNLIDSMARVVESPQGPLLKNEINSVLDNMLEAATSGDRRGLTKVIEQKKLRQ